MEGQELSYLVSELFSGLFNEPKADHFKQQIQQILNADCLCLARLCPKGDFTQLGYEFVFFYGCKQSNRVRFEFLMKGIPRIPEKPLTQYRVFTGGELSSLNLGDWRRLLMEVYQAYWEHASPSYYLFSLLPMGKKLGLAVFRRSIQNGKDFSEREKGIIHNLCPHLENYFRLSYLCSFFKKEGWAMEYLKSKGLTKKENQVAVLTIKGMGVKEIASSLDITEHTVRDHLKKIYSKLEVHSRAEMVSVLIRLWEGLIEDTFGPEVRITGRV